MSASLVSRLFFAGCFCFVTFEGNADESECSLVQKNPDSPPPPPLPSEGAEAEDLVEVGEGKEVGSSRRWALWSPRDEGVVGLGEPPPPRPSGSHSGTRGWAETASGAPCHGHVRECPCGRKAEARRGRRHLQQAEKKPDAKHEVGVDLNESLRFPAEKTFV